MYRSVLNTGIFILLVKIISGQRQYPSTPTEYRGLWCITVWDETRQNYSEQLGQAFFYNNETFTINSLTNINYTWINNFVAINKTDNQGTYQIFTDTSQGPPVYVNITSCFWRRQISNGDIIWGRQSNGTCTPTFEVDTSTAATRYSRNVPNCLYMNDEGSHEIISNTLYENELLQFDKSLAGEKQQGIVFYGSSSIRLWSSLTTDFSNISYTSINRGFGGSTLKQCWQQLKRVVLPLEPRILIVYAGENDIAQNETPENMQLVFRQFIQTIRRFYSSLPIAFISIKPSPSRINFIVQVNISNSLIKEDIQTMENVEYIDIFHEMLTVEGKPRPELFLADNLHMNEQGYAVWTNAVNNYLRTNGFISKGFINCEISFVVIVMNLFIFYLLF